MNTETREILFGVLATLRSEGAYMHRHDIQWREISLARAEVFALLEVLNTSLKGER